jgi:tetratricopeptide (TPR) repeat protein
MGELLSLPIPQGVTRGELAFCYAQLGAGEKGLEVAKLGLAVVSEHTPAHRPFVLAAIAQCHLVSGDLDAAEEAVRQARTVPQWMVWPPYCMALVLAEGQLRLAQSENHAALEIAEGLAIELRRMGMRSYLPAALDAAGQALLGLGEVDEARARFLEAREVAVAMGARARLWRILWHLSQIEDDPDDAATLRVEARALVEYIADHAGSPELRTSFLQRPEVRELFEAEEGQG